IQGGTGGTIDYVSGPSQFHITGTILAWEPPHLFEHEWNVIPRPELSKGEQAFVRWELTDVGGKTLVRMSFRHLHRGTASGFVSGVHAFLDRLGAQLDGLALPDWSGLVQNLRKEYPGPWQ
ncbi:MAG: SRPBCC domain-containing protein, partial [Nitrososphaerales archaeon]